MSRRGRHFVPFSLFSFQDIITSVTAVIILITLIMVLELVNRSVNAAASPMPPEPAVDAAEARRIEAEIADLERRLRDESAVLSDVAAGNPAQLRRQISELDAQMQAMEREQQSLESQLADATKRLDHTTAEWKIKAPRLKELDALREQSRRAADEVATVKRENALIYNSPAESSKRAWLVDIAGGRLAVIDLATGNETSFDSSILDSDVAQFQRWASKLDLRSTHFVLLVRPTGIRKFAALRTGLQAAGFSIGFDLIDEKQAVRSGRL